MKRPLALLCMTVLLAGCASIAEERLEFTPLSFAELPGWKQEDGVGALQAFARSCEAYSKKDAQEVIGNPPLAARASIWKNVCKRAQDVKTSNTAQARQFFTDNFTPFRLHSGENTQAFLTGYFEPLLYGSRKKEGRYRFPLYQLPSDIVSDEPYFSRQEIEEGALFGRGLELLWVDDDIALFFMHIQGSGQVQLTDGTRIRVGYAGKNHHPYYAIGKTLLELGELKKENISMLSIQHWLWNHPHKAREILWQNPSYIFFREIKGEGPIGSQGIALTAERSLAIDPQFIPFGMLVFVTTHLPSPPLESDTPFAKLMVAQDSGSAIKGPLRGDMFFGSGGEAGMLAGFMKQKGSFTLLLPNEIAEKLLLKRR